MTTRGQAKSMAYHNRIMYGDAAVFGVFRIAIYSETLNEPIVTPLERFLRVGDDGRPSWDQLWEIADMIVDAYDSDLEDYEETIRCEEMIGKVYVPLKFIDEEAGPCSVRIWRIGPDSAPRSPGRPADAPSLKGTPGNQK